MRQLGLKVALSKSEALCFHKARQAPPLGSHLIVGGTQIFVRSDMKYLGLVLDSQWRFNAHFKQLTPRLTAAAGALSRLLPNLRGPSATCRRLYMGVIRSMALYGAPVWIDAMSTNNTTLLRRVQRVMAQRVACAYRTVSSSAALALAGTLPWDLDALVLAAVYQWRGDQRSQGQRPAPREIEAKRKQWEDQVFEVWRDRLARGQVSRRTVGAISPVLNEWMVTREEAWQAMQAFCEAVMSQKEAAEREREASASAPMIRRRRIGQRRRIHVLHLPLPNGPQVTDTGVSVTRLRGPATAQRVTPRAARRRLGGSPSLP
ncbi:hypothetical protein ABMA28_014027 [Loxostege sticticalis]|uniref:Reverse transcriptase n=1 Tax=Loxostege sticticalis TaxID=481309 RepID=A0ABD0TF91_LOXSC